MKKYLIFGLASATISSLAVGVFLYFFYDMEFDESYKVMPIWKVVAWYFAISLPCVFLLRWVYEKFNNTGVLALNGFLVLLTIASIGLPITYTNQEIDTTFLPVAAIPAHFILPLVWCALQPIALYKK